MVKPPAAQNQKSQNRKYFNGYIAPNVLLDSLFPELIMIEEDVYLTRGVKVICHFNSTDSIKKIIGKESI